MLISLSEVITTKDNVRQYQVPIELDKIENQGSSYEIIEKDPVSLTITNLGNKRVMMEGSTHISLTLSCNRCLKEVIFPMNIVISKEIDLTLTAEEHARDLDETNYIIGYNLDVDILIYDEILLGFPMKVLCKRDCKGFCKQCGTNLRRPVTVIKQNMILECQ